MAIPIRGIRMKRVLVLLTLLSLVIAAFLVLPHASADEMTPDDDPSVYKTVNVEVAIPPGQEYFLYFDSGNLQLGQAQEPTFPDTVEQAIAKVPEWMRNNLTYKFRQLPGDYRDTYASLINGAQEKYRDEIGFCIAHTPVQTLTHDYMFPVIYKHNAQMIYQLEPFLPYVRLVENDDHTTVEYNTSDGVWEEVDKDIYYWGVVHPQMSDEIPTYVDPDYDFTSMPPFDRDYGVGPEDGEFWREWFWYHNDTGYPLLSEVMATRYNIRDAIHGLNSWVGGSMQFTSDMERPNQPVRIYRKHIGRCGEHQDMRSSSAKTTLIPCLATSNPAEDHVWNHYWEDNRWIHWDGAIDRPLMYENGWGKTLTTVWTQRGDGHISQDTPMYSEGISTIEAQVLDDAGLPVDGAMVTIRTENFHVEGTLATSTWAITDSNGMITVPVGDSRNYWVTASSAELGEDPQRGSEQLIEGSVDGETYTHTFNLPESADNLMATNRTSDPPAGAKFKMELEFDVRSHIIEGRSAYSGDRSDIFKHDGEIDFFIADRFNYVRFDNNIPFDAYEVKERVSEGDASFVIPTDDTWYAVLSNRFAQESTKYVNITMKVISGLELEVTRPSPDATLDLDSVVKISGTTFSPREVTSVDVQIDGREWIKTTDTTGDYSGWNYDWDTLGLIPGTHNIKVRVVDSEQNKSTEFDVTLADVTNPLVTIDSPNDGFEVRKGMDVTFMGTASDNVGITNLEFLVDWVESSSKQLSLIDGGYTHTIDTNGLDDGSHTMAVRATDAAGNVYAASHELVVLESTAPEVRITSPQADTVHKLGDRIEVKGIATDNREIEGLWLYVDGVNPVDLMPKLGDGVWSHYLSTDNLGQNARSLKVVAVDTAHNQANHSVRIYLDGTVPSLMIKGPTNEMIYGNDNDVTLFGTVTDNYGVSKLEVMMGSKTLDITSSLSGDAFSHSNWDAFSLGPGTHTFTLQATDVVGHITQETFSFTLDGIDPQVTIWTPKGTYISGEGLLLSGTIIDDSTIAMVELVIDNSDSADITSFLAGSALSFNFDSAKLTGGTHYFTVIATDAAGNSGQAEISVVVIDSLSDSDGDTMPDLWEMDHGLNPNLADGGYDADNDGFSNLEEYNRGTDPSDAASKPPTSAPPEEEETIVDMDIIEQLLVNLMLIIIALVGLVVLVIVFIVIIVVSKLRRG